jgi:L-rhamnose-H+ transport protein
MTLVRRWSWEHTWATFSLLGMLVFNWIITLLFIPNISAVYAASPARDLVVLALFGLGWGVGAVLFGLGMEKLGMALGYPIIMGLIASLGSLIPLMVFFPQTLLTTRGLILLAGTALVIFGIVLCSLGGSRRVPSETTAVPDVSVATRSNVFRIGVVIAILAGILSCLPNVGMAFGANLISSAETLGISHASSGNAVWALLFTFGFVANLLYCLFLMITKRSFGQYWNSETPRNLGLSALMAVMWIGSFYLYGAGAARLGRWGAVVGWPLFISLSIVVGNLWGLYRCEWKGAPARARRLLNLGLLVLIIAVITVALSNSF